MGSFSGVLIIRALLLGVYDSNGSFQKSKPHHRHQMAVSINGGVPFMGVLAMKALLFWVYAGVPGFVGL